MNKQWKQNYVVNRYISKENKFESGFQIVMMHIFFIQSFTHFEYKRIFQFLMELDISFNHWKILIFKHIIYKP